MEPLKNPAVHVFQHAAFDFMISGQNKEWLNDNDLGQAFVQNEAFDSWGSQILCDKGIPRMVVYW